MPVGAADGDEEGIKVARCLVASGAENVQKGGQWWVKKGPLNGGGWLGGERRSGGEIGEKKGDPRSIALRRHCGKLCKLEAAANYFASM